MADKKHFAPINRIIDDKLSSKTDCPHCKFLYDTFIEGLCGNSREYYLMTEVFVYLHGGDECNYSTENKIQPLKVEPIYGIDGLCMPGNYKNEV